MRIFTILIGVLLLVGCESKINHINTVYIFNDKTQLWDRARLDDLKNAKCESLRFNNIADIYDDKKMMMKDIDMRKEMMQ